MNASDGIPVAMETIIKSSKKTQTKKPRAKVTIVEEVCKCTGREDQIARCKMHCFLIPTKDYQWGFPIRDDKPPQLNAIEVVLRHSEPLRFNMNYSHGSFKELGSLSISKNVSIERQLEWDDEDIEQEVNDLLAMSIEDAREWLKENTVYKTETDDDVKASVIASIAETERDYRCETVRARSTNGEYTLDDLAKIVYYGARSFKSYNEHEMVYEIQVDVKSNTLHYNSNT